MKATALVPPGSTGLGELELGFPSIGSDFKKEEILFEVNSNSFLMAQNYVHKDGGTVSISRKVGIEIDSPLVASKVPTAGFYLSNVIKGAKSKFIKEFSLEKKFTIDDLTISCGEGKTKYDLFVPSPFAEHYVLESDSFDAVLKLDNGDSVLVDDLSGCSGVEMSEDKGTIMYSPNIELLQQALTNLTGPRKRMLARREKSRAKVTSLPSLPEITNNDAEVEEVLIPLETLDNGNINSNKDENMDPLTADLTKEVSSEAAGTVPAKEKRPRRTKEEILHAKIAQATNTLVLNGYSVKKDDKLLKVTPEDKIRDILVEAIVAVAPKVTAVAMDLVPEKTDELPDWAAAALAPLLDRVSA